MTVALALCAAAGCGGSDGSDGEPGDDGADGADGTDGADGADGTDGDDGADGDQGDPGPLNAPPRLTSLTPAWGSALTQVTITGTNFSTTPGDNHVSFNGYPAEVLSASATALVVTPGVATDDPMDTVVNVERANQVSNGLAFELVPSGYSREGMMFMPNHITSAVQIGTNVYIAAGTGTYINQDENIGAQRSAGLYAMDVATGVTRKVFGGSEFQVPYGEGDMLRVLDAPVALFVADDLVYFTTGLGAVRVYDPATGVVLEVLGTNLDDVIEPHTELPALTGLAVVDDAIFLANRDTDTVRAINDTDDVTWGGFDLGEAGVQGLTADASNIYVTRDDGTVTQIADPFGAGTITSSFVTGLGDPFGIMVHEGALLIADNPDLMTAPLAGGAATVFESLTPPGHSESISWTLSANIDGDIFLTQPVDGSVRRLDSGATDAMSIASGLPLATLGVQLIGGRIYAAGLGGAVPGRVVEIRTDGTSRLLYSGLTTDVAAGLTANTIVVSDAMAGIIEIDLTTLDQTVLLDAADGVTQAFALHRAPDDTLYYFDLSSSDTGEIGSLDALGTHDPAFSDLSAFVDSSGQELPASMTGNDTDLVLAWILGPSGKVVSIAMDTGAPTQVVPDGHAVYLGTVTNTGQRMLATRLGIGDVYDFDAETGAFEHLGDTTDAGQSLPGDLQVQTGILQLGLPTGLTQLPDGTIVAMEYATSRIVEMAP